MTLNSKRVSEALDIATFFVSYTDMNVGDTCEIWDAGETKSATVIKKTKLFNPSGYYITLQYEEDVNEWADKLLNF